MLLTPLYTKYLEDEAAFGRVTEVFAYIMILNVVLTYGMETAFFRFFNDEKYKEKALGTALISLLFTTLTISLLIVGFSSQLGDISGIKPLYIKWVIGIIALDTLTVIPFAYLRAKQESKKYASIKMLNVIISVSLASFFLIFLPDVSSINKYLPKDEETLIYIAFFAASLLMFLIMSRVYFQKWQFNMFVWKKMIVYGFPILIAGIAFALNESFDKIIIPQLISGEVGASQLGIYAACYKLSVGMTLFATAFKLGVEPFFFSESKKTNALQMYAQITKAFVVLGTISLFLYIVFIDVIKEFLIQKTSYWEAMDVVPLVLVAYLFFGIYQTLSVWYKVTDKTKYGAYISILGAILTIVVNVIWIPKIGYMASAIATCGAYGLMMIISYFMGRKHFPIPYDIKNICLYLVLSIGFSAVFFYILRDYFGIGSLPLYLAGIAMTAILIGIIWYKEQALLARIVRIRKKK